jgi:hypothetical protein
MNRGKMRVINRCFIALFILMLFMPLVFVDLSLDRISAQENRGLARPPSLSDMKKHPRFFVHQFDAWFKDSTGFREQMLTLYNVLNKNKSLVGFRYIEGQYTYLVGEDGHHYFADVDGKLIPKFQGKQFLSGEKLQTMTLKLQMVKTYLDQKGIPLIVMFCADKESIYPEFYPKTIKRGPEPIQLDAITGYLREHTSVEIFNIKQALLEKKNDYLLYYLIDTMSFNSAFAHYNEIGAFFAYRELMKHINTHFPNIVPYELEDIKITYDKNEIPYVSLAMEKTYKNLGASFFDGLSLNNWTRIFDIAFENRVQGLPVILFFRDSYADEQYIGKYFAQHFGKTIFIHYFNIGNIEKCIDLFNPDIVIFESAERGLQAFADYVAGIPEL